MDYALAKQLKDAGFPLKRLKDWNMVEQPAPWGHFNVEGITYIIPTLSELMETTNCRYLMAVEEGTWVAGAFKADGPTYGTHYASEKSHTPEEAVARLWLALNVPRQAAPDVYHVEEFKAGGPPPK